MLASHTSSQSHPFTIRRRWSAGALLLVVVAIAGCAVKPWSEPSVVVLVSDTTPEYVRVAQELQQRLPARQVIQLKGSARQAEAAVHRLAAHDDTIVAIGALALQSARRLEGRRIVFCQVFNYEEPGMLASSISGVKAMPPLAKQFQAWKLLDPNLNRIVVVTGPGLRDLPTEAKRAADELKLGVTHVVVKSDKELVYTARAQLRAVQGIWIAPDHRILSQPALREVLMHAVRQGVAVMVFNHQLLDEGAVLSAESDYTEISEHVVELVRAPFRGQRLVSLRRARIKVNDLVATRLGLSAPAIFERGVYVF